MIGSKVDEADLGRAALFAYEAGVTGILANLFLIGFYALQVGRPENGTWLGSANDLAGPLGTAFMIPVPLAFETGGVLAATGMTGTPFWFLLLGRHLGRP